MLAFKDNDLNVIKFNGLNFKTIECNKIKKSKHFKHWNSTVKILKQLNENKLKCQNILKDKI